MCASAGGRDVAIDVSIGSVSRIAGVAQNRCVVGRGGHDTAVDGIDSSAPAKTQCTLQIMVPDPFLFL